MSRPIVFICGDLHNLGDLALLLQNIEIARASARAMRVRRWQPLPQAIVAQVEAAGATLFDGRSMGATLSAAYHADVVIGGGQMVRPNTSLRSLALLAVLTRLASATGGRVVCRGLGVSRLAHGTRRRLWRFILSSCERVHVRDESSRRNVATLCPPAKVELTADMAFHPGALHARLESGPPAGSAIVVAPCVDASEGRSIEGPAFAALIAAAGRRLHGGITYACHDPRPDMDRTAASRLRDQAGPQSGEIHDDYALDALFALYRGAALVVTNRLHATIFAILAERAVLVIDDGTHKIAEVAGRFGLPSIDAVTPLTPAEADQLIDVALSPDRARRSACRREMSAAAARNLA